MSLRSRDHCALLLSGGSGTRFWPKSRQRNPKQFLCLGNNISLFCSTIERILPLIAPENIFIATGQPYRNKVRSLCRPYGIPDKNIIVEPSAKNTAACIATGVHLIARKNAHARVCVLPCDHLIVDEKKFRGLLSRAFSCCADSLVVFGVRPTRPETGYGYIRIKKDGKRAQGVYAVERFLEKPDQKTAERFFKDDRYFWNSGMFIASARVFMEQFCQYMPDFYVFLKLVRNSDDIKKIWGKAPALSFDYAVMEKSASVAMIPTGKIGWSDLGGWKAYDEILPKDGCTNHRTGEAITVGCEHVTVLADKRFIAAVGIKDIMIVDTPDALLIVHKERTGEVKSVVEHLKHKGRKDIY